MTKSCIICNIEYQCRGAKSKANSKFCSYKCKYEYDHLYRIREKSHRWKDGIREKVCPYCDTIFRWEDNPKSPYSVFLKRKFCSRDCKVIGQKYNRGAESWNWKGGISKRDMQKQHEWSQSIFKRDNYTCQDCGKHGGDLQAHHIKGFTENPELRWEMSNGQTLCKPCHYKTYKFYRNQFCTAN